MCVGVTWTHIYDIFFTLDIEIPSDINCVCFQFLSLPIYR